MSLCDKFIIKFNVAIIYSSVFNCYLTSCVFGYFQVKYHEGHEKDKGHYMANTLADFPAVVHSGQMEKMKPMVGLSSTVVIHHTVF